MGGYGSGRNWQSGKSTTDSCSALDVRRLQRDGLLTAGRAFGLNWSRNGNTVASIKLRSEANRLILIYRQRANGADWQQMEYGVGLDWTPCTYGGQRAWFLCPAKGCGRRVALLYIGSAGIFACRHCYKLAYASQRERSEDRAARKAGKIRERLGWAAGIFNLNGGKPKGMHWQTYWRLNTQHDQFVGASLAGMAERLGMLNGRLNGLRHEFKRKS